MLKYYLLFPFVLSLFFVKSQIDILSVDTSKEVKLEQSRKDFLKHIPTAQTWVNDWENLFTAREEKKLNKIISSYNQLTTIQIVIVTIDSNKVSFDNFDDLTLHIAKTWGVGLKGKDNGILIGISKSHRRIRIQNGYGIEKLISDDETKQVIDAFFIPDFKNGFYFDGTKKGLIELIRLLNSKDR